MPAEHLYWPSWLRHLLSICRECLAAIRSDSGRHAMTDYPGTLVFKHQRMAWLV
jgi:hypothetical protein